MTFDYPSAITWQKIHINILPFPSIFSTNLAIYFPTEADSMFSIMLIMIRPELTVTVHLGNSVLLHT